jgi:uncharacterized protein
LISLPGTDPEGLETMIDKKSDKMQITVMINRPFWLKRLYQGWDEAPIVWLAGVRRTGKTTMAKSLDEKDTEYINCDLPITEEMISDPELFFKNRLKKILVFDEIHQLKDPSRILKIGADLFPGIKILATGSSTLAASKKFKDTLTGRKRLVHLTPVGLDELAAFNNTPLQKRLFHGGLPQPMLADEKKPSFYREWMDSFFARDVQKLFAFRDFGKFNPFFEYVLKQSGGMFDVSKASAMLGISRPTAISYLNALEMMHAVTVLRPFFGGGQKELTRMPKVYGFDTGFVSFCRGWDPLRQEDYGNLWEHLVLEHLQARFYERRINYWRDSSGRELDFVLPGNRESVDVVECKWDPSAFESKSLKAFRGFYPGGNNYLVCPLTTAGYFKEIGSLKIYICNPTDQGFLV